ncbi:HAMP domain-containing histidine kinase [Ruminococcaceae bacterium OttesenSCG-928-A16]|nr:HAMP domain-containing histidine kinase [Ruminococcaceae bacterium OttesenSCG-928-A16]
MKDSKAPMDRFKCWMQGSIRRRLTVFVVGLCLLLVCLVWIFAVQLMEPVYNSFVKRDLESVMYGVTATLERAQAKNTPITEDDGNGERQILATNVTTTLEATMENGTINAGESSVDIAGADLKCLYWHGPLSETALHPPKDMLQGIPFRVETDSELVTLLRLKVRQEGNFFGIISSGQMVVGTTTANGLYTVIVSANIERIPQAVRVLKQLMFPVLMVLILVSILAAWGFSRWFTRPLSRLSVAAKEVAKGNYDVEVHEEGSDEIAALAQDFNTMTQEVKRSAELQRDIIANVSHDLRTPLTLIKGYAETVRDLTGDEPAKRTQQLSVIINETDRLSVLVNSVMELSRMSSGHEKPEMVQFDVAQLCDELAFGYKEMSHQEGYFFHFESEQNCEIVADPAMVERALHNLLGNAAKHVGADGYLGLRVFKTQHKTVRIEVTDHGEGILPEDLPHLFDKYYRSRADAGKAGTGLGLSITKAIFVAHGFEYGVDSTPGHGATFWFEAPLAAPGVK